MKKKMTYSSTWIKRMRSASRLLVLLLPIIQLSAQELDLDRVVDWSSAGLIDEFGQDYQLINISEYGIDHNAGQDVSISLQKLIDSLDARGYILYFPAGNYVFHNTISLKENIILRGQSSSSVVFRFDLGGAGSNCINVNAYQKSDYTDLKGGYHKTSMQLEVRNPSGFSEAKWAEVDQQNGDWDINPASWSENAVGQIVSISKLSGNIISLKEGLRYTYSEELKPQIKPVHPIMNVGIENLAIQRIDKPNSTPGYNISFSYAVNCYLRGVESQYSQGSHVMASNCSNLEVSGSYFHDAFVFDGSGTKGYGVTMNLHSGACLIENNIFKRLRHAMMVKAGANGNVFAYNYSLDVYRDEFPTDASGDISLHGHYSYGNLFEGNIVQNIVIDHYWGPSGPYNTFFRNRAESYGLVMTNSVDETDVQNFIGNEIPNFDTYRGIYYLTGEGHYEFANNIRGTIIPSDDDQLTLASYCYNARPWFFSSSDVWPPIGLPNKIGEESIPAKSRYENEEILTEVKSLTDTYSVINPSRNSLRMVEKFYPNPFRDKIFIEFNELPFRDLSIYLYDFSGRLVEKYADPISDRIVLNVNPELPSGVYFIKLQSETDNQVYKIIK